MTTIRQIFSLLLCVAAFYGCGLFSSLQDVDKDGDTDGRAHPEEAAGETQAMRASSGETQSVAASSSGAISGAGASFPPGSLSVDTSVSIEQGASLATTSLGTSLGKSDTDFSEGGPAVVVSSSEEVDPAQPFSLSLPIADGAGLLLTGDDHPNMLIVAKVSKFGLGGSVFLTIFTRDRFSVEDGKAIIDTFFFGSYQVVIASKLIDKPIEIPSKTPILTKKEENTLAEVEWAFNPTTYTAGVVNFSATATAFGVLAGCTMYADEDKVAPWDHIGTSSIPNKNFTIAKSDAHTLFGRFDCVDVNGRSDTSEWTEGIAVPYTGGPTSTLSITTPAPTRSFMVADEYPVTFNWTGDVLECSSDAGATYNPCTTATSFTWLSANYGVEHRIRVSKNAEPPIIYSFVPSSEFSGSTLLTCDETVSVSETITALNGRLTDNKTVCVNNGVNFTGTGPISFSGKTNINLYVRSGDYVTVQPTTQGGIYIWNSPNINIVGLSVTTAGYDAVAVGGGTSTGFIEDFDITTTGLNASGVEVANGGSVTVKCSQIDVDGSSAIETQGHTSDPWSVTASNLRIIARSGSLKATRWDHNTAGSGTGSLTDSEVFIWESTASFGGAAYIYGTSGTTTFDGNTFIRMNQGAVDSWALQVNLTSGYTSLLRSDFNTNRFCAQNPGTRTFTTGLNTSDAQTNFSAASQLDGGAVLVCPAWVVYPP